MTHSRYLTLGGAAVAMTEHPDVDNFPGLYVWRCDGCQDRPERAEREHECRRAANHHAGVCRSMPPSA